MKCLHASARGEPPLPYHFGVGHSSSSCADACKHFIFFALTQARDFGECLCGDTLRAEHQLEPGKCGEVCDGEEGATPPRYCGTKRSSALYKSLGCHDAVEWSNGYGYTCAEYAHHKWCVNGTLRDESTGGESNHHPERNCCVCGRASASPDTAEHAHAEARARERASGGPDRASRARAVVLVGTAAGLLAALLLAVRRRAAAAQHASAALL
eukprot:CAMPEP_0119413236 /NCGR_PEP_ID=MMETSP1335-20130426/5387_1 /TAXON_ID=259385 /ORGANISM="Chrysoculter rhomboideus, Strain RCC1486" /LENGTH=211 /DNA_ID=CAMNT_0007438017 /DNA_START=1 /DNA_END=636 /DNA_ORIENTATION=+